MRDIAELTVTYLPVATLVVPHVLVPTSLHLSPQ
jgi:hypothetical protein